jgi:hypothetical protein
MVNGTSPSVIPALTPILNVLYWPIPPNTLAVEASVVVVVVVAVLVESVWALAIPTTIKEANDNPTVFFNVE